MKTISTLLIALILSTSIFAAGIKPTCTLTIKSLEKSAIVVIVDGKRFDFGSSSIMITDLDPSYHDVKVYQEKMNGSVYFFGKTYSMLFNSSVLLKPRTSLLIAIDDCDVITMNETKIKRQKIGDNWQGGDYYDNSNYASENVSSKTIDNNDFSRVLWAMSKESQETNKMKSAEQIIDNNYFSTEQVKQMLQLFNSDDNKLELAKLAYNKTIDQSNYYTINNIFKFDSDRDELARCVRSY